MIRRTFSHFHTLTGLAPRVIPTMAVKFPFSTAAAEKEVETYDDYRKEIRLKEIEGTFDAAIPKLLRGSYNSLVLYLDKDSFRFEDKVWDFETSSIAKAVFRLAKIRLYLAFKSPHNRLETLGTHICLEDNLVTLIWRLSWPDSVKSAYFLTPKSLLANFSAFTSRANRTQIGRIEHKLAQRATPAPPSSNGGEPPNSSPSAQEHRPPATNADEEKLSAATQKLTRIEQCLDVHVNDSGFVKRLVVRPVTSHDFELAKLRKMELENEVDERWRRATREEREMKEEKGMKE